MTLPYIINAALILAACLAFYKVLLRRETFYRINRYLLVVCLFISFTLPLLSVPQKFSFHRKETVITADAPLAKKADESPVSTKPNAQIQPVEDKQQVNTPKSQKPVVKEANNVVASNGKIDNSNSTTSDKLAKLLSWLITLYWFGAILFAASFLFQLAILIYRAVKNPIIRDGQFRIVEIKSDLAPCSFANMIFINPEKYDWDTYNQILEHEKIHIRQKHTIDILFAELVLIFQWFNPFAWIYRREIENNLEFLTDDQVMHHEAIDKKRYQLSLVKVSAPNFPLSLTTNYNQSILKTRIAMMNRKRSNLHTAWKYFFLMPVLAFLACLLNEPSASSQDTPKKGTQDEKIQNEKPSKSHEIQTEGSWFATIKDEKIFIQFKRDDDVEEHNYSGNSYKLTEFTPAPREGVTSFKMTRDAGTMEFNGKFEGKTGMGHYKFVADNNFATAMKAELKEKLDDEDMMVFFFVNVNRGFVSEIKSEGYNTVTKDEIIPLAALDVDKNYIHSMKNAGFKDLTLEHLVSLKALGVDEKYVAEIRSAGYKNITSDQIVSFKAQGIDKEYIGKVRQMKGKDAKDDDNDADDIVSFKAMGIDETFVNSFKAVGLTNIPHEQLVSMKAVGVTPDYVKTWQAAGFKDIEPEQYVAMKSQDVTPEYMKGFTDLGYKNVKPENLVSFRALGVTPEYIKSFEAMGYKDIDMDELPGLKSQNVTPETIRSFEALGFKNIQLEDMISVKAMGVTPEYIKDMRAKGFNYDRLEKYVRLKSID